MTNTTCSPASGPRPTRPGGEKRGNSKDRRARKLWMLIQKKWNGNGKTCNCVHCGCELNYDTVEADRIIPGGSYRRDNIQPACRHCNASRSNNVDWVAPLAIVA